MLNRIYFVYIVGSLNRTIYVGFTSGLRKRVFQHKTKRFTGFTSRYGCDRLLYVREFDDPVEAIAYEKRIKRWRREKKTALIDRQNPGWQDISASWFAPEALEAGRIEAALLREGQNDQGDF